MNNYTKQNRGALSEYEAYFSGMDASMQQKIALTTAHFPIRGRVADMGSGSGSGTFDLARLYRSLALVGVDINPVTVEYSRTHYRAANLEYAVGDIAERVFAENSLDGILDSSVLHHVTSFNDFDLAQIAKTIKNQVAQLKTGGVLIIRDFVVPDEAEKKVFLDLPTDDGKTSGDVGELSTAALFEVFARDFRSSLNFDEPVRYRQRDCPRENFARFEMTLRAAAEFVLRKDYRDHWAPELLEEYTYYAQADFEAAFRKENLRLVVSMPLWNPWIVENRFEEKFYLSDSDGNSLKYPPTNFLIVGEKVDRDDGVQLIEKTAESIDLSLSARPSFLRLKAYRHRETAQIFELAERPHQTIDLLPWFESESGQLFVLAKKDFPRPVVNAQKNQKNLHRANYSGYLTEPISAISDSGFGIPDLNDRFSVFGFRSSQEENRDPKSEIQNPKSKIQNPIIDILEQRANLSADEIFEIGEPQFYFTSPGGIDECVQAHLVRVAPFEKTPQEIENYTPFVSAGHVRELDALQVLRASHVGGMFDARLEIGIYRLLKKLNRTAGAWIGAAIAPTAQKSNIEIADIAKLSPARRKAFEPVELVENSFLRLVKGEFVELDSKNAPLARAEFEYVVPKFLSRNTTTAIPFFQTADGVFVGLEFRDLPAPQRFTGNSLLPCAPAWRLPFSIEHKFDLVPFLREKFPLDFAVSVRKTWELGGSYFTSAGVTPEIVYPFAVELDAANSSETGLRFFHLKDLLESTDRIRDAHLLITLNRLGHALGFLSK